MAKEKKEKRKSEVEGASKEENWDVLLSRVGPIAQPLAPRKLTKKLYKIVKKGGDNCRFIYMRSSNGEQNATCRVIFSFKSFQQRSRKSFAKV